VIHTVNLGYPVGQASVSAANAKTKQLALRDIHSKHKGLHMPMRAASVTAASHVITQRALQSAQQQQQQHQKAPPRLKSTTTTLGE